MCKAKVAVFCIFLILLVNLAYFCVCDSLVGENEAAQSVQSQTEKMINTFFVKPSADLWQEKVIDYTKPSEEDSILASSTEAQIEYPCNDSDDCVEVYDTPNISPSLDNCVLARAHEHQLPKKGDLLSYAELTRLTYEGPDFVVSSSKGNGAYLIVAPHGGVIEPGTDLLAKMIANNGNYGLYTFTSNKQICDDISGCRAMHITSTKFNEPALEKLLAYYTSTTGVPVSIHGYGSLDKQEPYPGETTNMIIIGGRNSGLKEIISNNLRTLGFSTDVRNSSKDGPFSGTNPNNFINITNPSGGVQIEVSRKYLRLFFYSDSAKCNLQPTNNANLFVNAILKSISDYDVIRGQQVCDSEGNCQILDENAPPKDLLQEARSMLDSAGFSKELLPEKYVVSGSVEIDGTKISARLTNKICSKNKSGTLILGDSKDHRICYNVTKNNLSSCGGDDTAIEGMDGKGFGITAGIIRIKIVGDKVKTTADVWPANITKTVPVSENGPPNFEICD